MADYIDPDELKGEIISWQFSQKASDRLVELIHLIVLGCCHTCHCDSEDIEQKTWLKLLTSYKKLKPYENPFAYISTIIFNIIKRNWNNNLIYETESKLDLNMFVDNGGRPDPVSELKGTKPNKGGLSGRNRMIEYDGRLQNIKQWSEELNINRYTLAGKLRSGLLFEDIVKNNNYGAL